MLQLWINPQGSHASWRVMEFKKGIFQAWKVLENNFHGKSLKSHGIPPIGHGIFLTVGYTIR